MGLLLSNKSIFLTSEDLCSTPNNIKIKLKLKGKIGNEKEKEIKRIKNPTTL